MSSAPMPELKERIVREVSAVPSRTRRQFAVLTTITLGLGLVLAFATWAVLGTIFHRGEGFGPIHLGGIREVGGVDVWTQRPLGLVLSALFTAVLISTVNLWAALDRGRSTVGRPRVWLAASASSAPVLLFSAQFGLSSLFPGQTVPWPGRTGNPCLAISLLVGLWPLLAMAVARRSTDPVHPAMTGAAMGVAAGGVSWVLVDLFCPVGHWMHLLYGHVLPIAILAVVGVVLGNSLVRFRA